MLLASHRDVLSVLARQAAAAPVFERSRHYVAPQIWALQTAVAAAGRHVPAVFTCQLTGARLAFLREFRLGGSVLLPAAALLEAATAAVRLLDEAATATALLDAAAVKLLPLGLGVPAADAEMSTSVTSSGSVTITTADGTSLLTAAAAGTAASLATAAAAPAAAAAAKPAGVLMRIVRSLTMLTASDDAGKPHAAVVLPTANAADGFRVYPGVLSAAHALAGVAEDVEVASAAAGLTAERYFVPVNSSNSGNSKAIWATAVEAEQAHLGSSSDNTTVAALQARSSDNLLQVFEKDG